MVTPFVLATLSRKAHQRLYGGGGSTEWFCFLTTCFTSQRLCFIWLLPLSPERSAAFATLFHPSISKQESSRNPGMSFTPRTAESSCAATGTLHPLSEFRWTTHQNSATFSFVFSTVILPLYICFTLLALIQTQ